MTLPELLTKWGNGTNVVVQALGIARLSDEQAREVAYAMGRTVRKLAEAALGEERGGAFAASFAEGAGLDPSDLGDLEVEPEVMG